MALTLTQPTTGRSWTSGRKEEREQGATPVLPSSGQAAPQASAEGARSWSSGRLTLSVPGQAAPAPLGAATSAAVGVRMAETVGPKLAQRQQGKNGYTPASTAPTYTQAESAPFGAATSAGFGVQMAKAAGPALTGRQDEIRLENLRKRAEELEAQYRQVEQMARSSRYRKYGSERAEAGELWRAARDEYERAAAEMGLAKPTFGERILKTLSGAGKQYLGSTWDTAGVMVSGGTAEAEIYQEQLESLYGEKQRTEEWLREPEDEQERRLLENRLASLNEQISVYEALARESAGLSEGVRDAAAGITQSGAADLERAKFGAGKAGQLLVDAGAAGAQMAADAALGYLTGFGSMAPMMVRSFGGGAQQAREKGYSQKQQIALGLSSAATEYFSEKLFGGNPVYDSDAGLVSKLVGKITSNETVLEYLASKPAEMLYEGLEEITADLLEPLAEQIIAGQHDELTLEQIIDDGIVGIMTAGIAQGGVKLADTATQGVNTWQTGKRFSDMGEEAIRAIVQEGLDSGADTKSYKLAQELQQKLDRGESISAAELGQLYQSNVQTIDAEEGGGLLERAAEELANDGRVTNSTARDILENPTAKATLETEAGLSITENMTMSQQRAAVKSAVESLASRANGTDTATATDNTTRQETAQTAAQARPVAQQTYDAARIRRAASALGENGAKALAAAYDGSVNADKFYAEFAAYYEAGVSGTDAGKVKGLYSGQLNEAQKYAAYVAGQNDAAASLAAERENVKSAAAYGKEAGFIQSEESASLPQETVRQYDSIARAVGVKIQISPSTGEGGANGWYANGIIHIAQDAKNPGMVVAKHEITHRMQELAPEEYRKYRDYVMNAYAQRDGSTASMIEFYKSRYAGSGINLSTEQAMDEAAADFTEALATDPKQFERLARQNRSVAQKLLDAVREFVNKIKTMFKGKETAQSQAQQDRAATDTFGMDIDTLEKATQLWSEALEAAARQVKTVGKVKNAARTDGAARYSINEQFSRDIQEWYEEGRPKGERFILGSTGAALQGLGAIESDIYMTSDKIKKILGKHSEMTINEIKRIPEVLEDPVLILKSKNAGGAARNSRLVMFGSVKARDGRPVMCVLDLRPMENGFLLDDMQKVTSAYTKDNNPVGFVSSSDVLFADKKRTAHLLSAIGFQMPITCDQSGYIGNIAYEHGNVKLTGEKFSDVVKLGEAGDAARTDSAARYSIKYDQNNNPYVVVETDILAGVPRSEWVRTVKDNLRAKFPEGVTVGRNVVNINAQSRREMTFSNYMKHLLRQDPQLYSDKLRATNNADEILQASRNWVNEAILHPRKDAIIDFARGEALLRIGGNDYHAQVIVGNRGNGKLLLYDIINLSPAEIKTRTKKTDAADTTNTPMGPRSRQTAPADAILAQGGGDVKRRFSLKSDSMGRELTKEQQEYFKDSKVVDDQGRLKVVYHGSPSDFNEFSLRYLGTNGTAEGYGFYFTDSREVAEAYSHGTEVQRHQGADGRLFEVYLNITKPLSGERVSMTRAEFRRFMREMNKQVDEDGEPLEFLLNYGDVSYEGLDSVINKAMRAEYDGSDNDINMVRSIINGNGNMEIVFDVLRRTTGFDGIIVTDASWGGDQTIYVAFHSNEVKNVTNKKPTTSPDIRYSLKTDNRGRKLTQAQEEFFSDSVIRDSDGRLMTMYHGTKHGGFNIFDGGKDYFYFTNNRRYAYTFEGRKANGQFYPSVKADMDAGYITPQRYEVYLNVKKPFITSVDVVEDAMYWDKSLAQNLRDKGYDALMLEDMSQVIVLNPEQIKLTSNKSPSTSDPDIRHSLKGSSDIQREVAILQEENRLLKEKAEYWKSQTKVTKDWERTLRQDDVDKLARRLVKDYSSKLDVKDVSGQLKKMGEYLVRNGDGINELIWSEVKGKAAVIAKDIVDSAEILNDEQYRQYSDLRSYLRGTPLILGPEYQTDIADFNDFRKRNFGRLNLKTKGSTNIDQVYEEMSSTWPEFFDTQRETHPVDQLLHIADVLDGLRPVYENPFSYDMNAAAEHVANDIIDSLIGGDVRQASTRADRAVKQERDRRITQVQKLEAEKAKGRQALEDLRAEKNQRIEQLKQQSSERVQEAVARERARRDEQIQRLKEKYKARENQNRERASDRQARDRLLKIAKRLQNKKLPAANRALLDQYIGDLDTAAKSMTGRTLDNLTNLWEWYADRKMNDPDFIADPHIEKAIARLSKRHISDLSAGEVAALTDVLLHIENEIRTERKLIDSEDRRDTYNMGEEVIRDIYATSGSKGGLFDRYIITETLSPLREVRRLTGYVDADPLLRLTQELANGQRKMFDYQMKAEKAAQPFAEDKEFSRMFSGPKAESVEITGWTKDGPATVKITPAMRTSLYLHSLNDQNLKHINDGGITVPDEKLYRKGKLAEAYNRGTTVRLTPTQVRAICGGMTAREKAFARMAHDYFNNRSRAAINEVSEKLKGFSIAQVENYFPINTDTSFTRSNFDSVKFDGSIEGVGFLKDRRNAANPILLRDANMVLEQSIQQHAKYYGLAIPIRNFNKVWGVTTGSFNEDGSRNAFESSVQQAVKKQWGEAGYGYIEKMMKDLQNSKKPKNVWAKALDKARSNYAGAVLTLNASVAMKQAASYPTAAAVLGWRPLLAAMKDFGRVDLDLIAKYTPLQWYRSKGFSTKELGDLQQTGGPIAKVMNNLPPVLNWVQGADLITTRKLWKASEYYVRQHSPKLQRGSDAYYRAVADIYDRVIEETQPNYTTMQRPQLLRSDDSLMSNLAMFKTQPFQNTNILYDAAANLIAKGRQAKNGGSVEALKEAKTNFWRAVSSQIVQQAFFAGMTMAWSMFRGKDDKYRDDETGELTLLSVLEALGKDMAVSTLTGIPFASDAWEFVSSKLFGDRYYGIDAVAVTAVTDTVSSLYGMGELIWNGVKSVAAGEEVDWNATRLEADKYFDDISKGLGVPFENVANLFNASYRQVCIAIMGKYRGEYAALKLTTDPEKKPGSYYDLLYRALKDGKTEDYQEFMEDLMSQGLKASSIESAMWKRMKDDFERDPDYSLYKQAGDLLGARESYGEERESESFTKADLDPEQYRSFSTARAENYRSIADEMEGFSTFQALDSEVKDKALKATSALSGDLALEAASGGEYTADTKWMLWATGGEDAGVSEAEAILFKVAYDMSESDKDPDTGKTVPGSKKENVLEAAAEMMPWLTDRELEYLMGNYWK